MTRPHRSWPLLCAAVMVVAGQHALAQSSLTLTDVLPPYLLSARLLSNGHFAVSTRYTGEPKTLVYREDGSGGRPVNYTSHVHFKVDDVVFQLPFELDPIRRDPPPEHPLTIARLFRDTSQGSPRINASMFGVMPDGDTLRFLLTLVPVERPSGGFIRLQTEVYNTSGRPRSVGVLMLVDTKIGDNDRAPIVTAFGYRTRETEHRRSTPPGMPEFWLALEGTPLAPGLTARGNLRASGLIAPDLFLAGNWKDNTAVPGAVGLGSVLWKERSAFDVEYTDSAVLLVWDEQTMAPGERRLRSATEIGIVDSLFVREPAPGIDLVLGGSGLGRGDGCIAFDTLRDRSCEGIHPYHPDPLNALYLVTNTGVGVRSDLRIDVGALPVGLAVDVSPSPFVPQMLLPGETGVSTLAFRAKPRLWDRTYSVPITLFADAIPVLMDSVCVVVPGLLGSISAPNISAGPLCPGSDDTLEIPVRLNGPRCLPLAAQLVGPPSEVARYEILDPIPDSIASMGEARIRVRHTAGPEGTTSIVRLVVTATDAGLNDDDRDTTVAVADTAVLTVESRNAELQFADRGDTLDFGRVCIGDTSARQWPVANIGGCDLVIRDDYRFETDALRQFAMADASDFPMLIARARDGRVRIRFAPRAQGVHHALLIVTSDAEPFVDTLVLRGRGDVPELIVGLPEMPDTICAGETFEARIPVTNPTGCPVTIAQVATDDPRFMVSAGAALELPPNSTRRIVVTARLPDVGIYAPSVAIVPAGLSSTQVPLGVAVVQRGLLALNELNLGEVRIRTGASRTLAIHATGTAPSVIAALRLTGPNADEYSVQLASGDALPKALTPGDSLVVEIGLVPEDLEQRRAFLVVEGVAGTLCGEAPLVELSGRGVLPLLDAPRRQLALDRLCLGRSVDTTIPLRNRGNADLMVASLVVDGDAAAAEVEVTGAPVLVQPDSTADVRVRITARRLGPFQARLGVVSNGEWLTAPDTIISVSATGYLCGDLWADTVTAKVGAQVLVPIHIAAPPLSPEEIVAALSSPNDSLNLELRYRSDLLMATSGTLSTGWFSGALTNAPGAVRIEGVNRGGGGGGIVAGIPMEVLLGSTDRSTLQLSVGKIAGGYSALDVHDGLLIAEYCAIDKRYVSGDGLWLASIAVPARPGSEIIAHVPEESHAVIKLYDAMGSEVALIHEGALSRGTTRLRIPADLAAGACTLILRTPLGHAAAPLVVVK